MAQTVSAAVATSSTAGVTEAKSGLPQFEFGVWPGQIVWLLITFAVVYAVLSRVLIPRMRSTFTDRDARIDADMAAARDLRAEAQAQARASDAETAAARARAKATADDAKARGQAQAAARNAALEAELDHKLDAAEAQIDAARQAAMSQVRQMAMQAAAEISGKLTGRPASAAEIEAGLNLASPQPAA